MSFETRWGPCPPTTMNGGCDSASRSSVTWGPLASSCGGVESQIQQIPRRRRAAQRWDRLDVNGHANPVHVATVFAEARLRGWRAEEQWEEPIPLRSPDVEHPSH